MLENADLVISKYLNRLWAPVFSIMHHIFMKVVCILQKVGIIIIYNTKHEYMYV